MEEKIWHFFMGNYAIRTI